jgi:tetratricopeptide (TPR) repeat protein
LPALALGLFVAATARGDARTSGQAYLERGLALYRSGEYRAAIAQFEAGYARVPRPAFLLDIAQSWRQLGELAQARVYYVRFVALAGKRDPARAQVLALIDKIDAQLREAGKGDAAATAATSEPPTSPSTAATPPTPTAGPTATNAAPAGPGVVAHASPSRARGRRAIGWAGVGLLALGLGGVGAGAGFAVLADRADTQFAHPPPGTVYDPHLYDRRALDRGLSIGLFVSGGALVLAGTVLAVLGWRGRPERF